MKPTVLNIHGKSVVISSQCDRGIPVTIHSVVENLELKRGMDISWGPGSGEDRWLYSHQGISLEQFLMLKEEAVETLSGMPVQDIFGIASSDSKELFLEVNDIISDRLQVEKVQYFELGRYFVNFLNQELIVLGCVKTDVPLYKMGYIVADNTDNEDLICNHWNVARYPHYMDRQGVRHKTRWVSYEDAMNGLICRGINPIRTSEGVIQTILRGYYPAVQLDIWKLTPIESIGDFTVGRYNNYYKDGKLVSVNGVPV